MNEALRRKEFSSFGREAHSLVLYGMRKAPLPIHPSIRAYSVLGVVVVLSFRVSPRCSTPSIVEKSVSSGDL